MLAWWVVPIAHMKIRQPRLTKRHPPQPRALTRPQTEPHSIPLQTKGGQSPAEVLPVTGSEDPACCSSHFGHVSVLNIASEFVTHAHVEAHIIIWLEGTAGEIDRRSRDGGGWDPGTAAGINSLPAAQPRPVAVTAGPACSSPSTSIRTGRARRRDLPSCAPLFASGRRSRWNPGCTRRRPTFSII